MMEYWETQAIINAFCAFFLGFLAIVFFAIAMRQRSLLDRYRIRYGFTEELELKEIDNPNNLEKRKKSFLRRTFKDMEKKD